MMKYLFWTALALATVHAHAADNKDEQLKLVQTKGCASCHGTRGQGNQGMKGPKLAGQTADALTEKIKAYRDGKKQNPTMAMMSYSLTDNDINLLAAYFSQFP